MKLARVGNKNSHGRACYADGGRVEEDISDPGSLPSVTSGMKTDGVAGIDGGKAKPRLDRARKPASTTVNIVVASNKPEQPPAPPVPLMPAMGGTPMPPPTMPAPGVPMRASGGRVNHPDAPEDKKMISKMVHKHEANMHKGKPETKFTKGGVVKASGQSDKTEKESMRAARATGGRVNVDAGAGGGLGRLEKAKDYGDKPAKGKK